MQCACHALRRQSRGTPDLARGPEARAVTNFAGNGVATVLVGHWTGTLNRERLDQVLAGDAPFDEMTMLDDDHSEGDRAKDVDSPSTTTA